MVPANITRKNLVSFYAQFYQPPTPTFPPTEPPPAPVIVNPTSAMVALYYKGTNGSRQSASIPMTLDSATNVWSAQWDSSNAMGAENEGSPDGYVDWMIFGAGAAQAARQGRFSVIANDANVI